MSDALIDEVTENLLEAAHQKLAHTLRKPITDDMRRVKRPEAKDLIRVIEEALRDKAYDPKNPTHYPIVTESEVKAFIDKARTAAYRVV